MALINTRTSAIAAPTTGVEGVSPILYDSNWVTELGDGTTTVIKTFSYDVDSIIYIFARRHLNTQPAHWWLGVRFDTTPTSFTGVGGWANLSARGDSPISSSTVMNSGKEYAICSETTVPNTNQASDSNYNYGFHLTAGEKATFNRTASATASNGMRYRIIVKASTADVQLARLTQTP